LAADNSAITLADNNYTNFNSFTFHYFN
jgi:hypothetical protein